MKVRVVYDGDCPFCSDYAAYQRLREAGGEIELVDARTHRESLAAMGISGADLEDGMVVFVDGVRHDGADAMHALSRITRPPGRWWVRLVGAAAASRPLARTIYPALKLGRRIVLRLLGISRFPR
jgi:predicted DCC family thiol-disulfide oxidoreductase YuxK